MDTSFSGKDLRNRSFRGQVLRGASFHAADLRGADFSEADLRGADLTAARTGMGRAWASVVSVLALIASLLIGIVSGIGGAWLKTLMHAPGPRYRAMGVFLTVELVLFLAALLWKGPRYALERVLPVAIALAAVIGLIAVATGAGTGSLALAVIAFSAMGAAVIAFATLVRVAAGGVSSIMFMVVAMSGAIVGGLTGGGLYATAVALTGMIAAQLGLRGKRSYPGLMALTVDLVCAGGTRFRGANLTGASFAAARLRHADFRGAKLDATRFDTARINLCAFDDDRRIPRGE
jgi:hypothetical protein